MEMGAFQVKLRKVQRGEKKAFCMESFLNSSRFLAFSPLNSLPTSVDKAYKKYMSISLKYVISIIVLLGKSNIIIDEQSYFNVMLECVVFLQCLLCSSADIKCFKWKYIPCRHLSASEATELLPHMSARPLRVCCAQPRQPYAAALLASHQYGE